MTALFACLSWHAIFILKERKMKNALKKALSLTLVIATLFLVMALTSCKQEPLVIKDSDEFIVITATEKSIEGKGEIMLIDYMKILKDEGELEYTVENGMITSINGISNAADYSKCWMLYTSDAENSAAMYGTVEYKGVAYGSAMLGAETLKVKAGEIYIWVFVTF